MALFQPTNVIPSTLSGEGNGTIDVTEPLTVSWQVNGNSPMVAYRIKIMQNDADSTLMLDTGKTTLTTPFSGNDRLGNPVTFSTVITAAQMSTAGMTNGYPNGYKMTIEQWWTANDSIEQTSASYFITRTTPAVIMGYIPYQYSFLNQEYTFTAEYAQAQGDALEWVRWELQAMENGKFVMVDDTGNIYNVGITYSDTYPYYPVVSYTHNGFSCGLTGIPGELGVHYRIRCTVQTENGVQATTGWNDIYTENITSRDDAILDVCSAKNTDAIRITMMKNFPLMGNPNGPYEYIYEQGVTFDRLELPSGSSVTWGGTGENSLSIQESPYVITLKVSITDASASVDFITAKYQTKDLIFSCNPNGFFIHYGNQEIWHTDTVPINDARVSISLHNESVDFGMRTSDDFILDSFNITTWQGEELESVEIAGPMIFWNIGIEAGNNGTPHSRFSDFAFVVNNWLYYTPNTQFILSFNHTLFTGSPDIGGAHGYYEHVPVDYLGIYKREKGSVLLNMLALLPLNEGTKDTVIMDYGVKNQKEYEYYLFFIRNAYTGLQLQTRSEAAIVKPCFWNYTVLCCEKDDNSDYIVKGEYRFALDVGTGNVGNNNSPTLQQNFTRYPLRQPVSNRYMSGTLSAYIGKAENSQYVDTVSLMDELYDLSINNQTKFLKTRKGQIFQVETSAPVVMSIGDKYAQQPAKISLPWVEIGDATNTNILGASAYGAVPRFEVFTYDMDLLMYYSESSAMGKDSFKLEDGDLYIENTGSYEASDFSINENGDLILDRD